MERITLSPFLFMMKKEFGNIDIIQTANDDFLILEVNSGIMIENYIKINPNEYEIAKIFIEMQLKNYLLIKNN